MDLPTCDVAESTGVTKGPIRSVAWDDKSNLVVATQNEVLLAGNAILQRGDSAIESARSCLDCLLAASREEIRQIRDGQLVSSLDLREIDGKLCDFALRNDKEIVGLLIRAGQAFVVGETQEIPFDSANDCVCASVRDDGLVAAIGYEDGTLQFWDVESRQPLSRRMSAGSSAVRSLTYSSDGQQVVSLSECDEVRIWDADFRFARNADDLQTELEKRTGIDLRLSDEDRTIFLSPADWAKRYVQ